MGEGKGRARRFAIVLVLVGTCICAHAETILVWVTETLDGQPAPLPPATAEGIMDSLFESGNIVIGINAEKQPASLQALVTEAETGGAHYILRADVTFTRTTAAGGKTTVSAAATYTLYAGGSPAGQNSATDDNRGREKDMDLGKLAFELGTKIAADSLVILDRTPEQKNR